MPGLQTWSLGPLTKGFLDSVTLGADLNGACRWMRNVIYSGGSKLSVRPGTALALTCKDDQGTPATVTSICAIAPFTDGALIVGYSSVTQKVYLYRVPATMDDWYNAAGTLQGTRFPQPVGVLWTGATVAPDVTIAEGLGTAYIANTGAADDAGLYYPMKSYVAPGTIATVQADLDGNAVVEDLYFSGCISFKQHLWAWGFGAGTTVGSTTYRPEMARFSAPNFGTFASADSITLGDRVRSVRERIVGAGIAGEALFLGGHNMLTRVTGFGRSSWYKQPLDRSYGFVGPKCMVTAGDTLYYWSPRGPMRVTDNSEPEPLWDALPATVATVVNTSRIVASFDVDRDQVLFAYDTGSGVGRAFCAFDVQRSVWVGPDADFGIALRCMGAVEPVYASTAVAPVGPSAAPSAGSTTSVGGTSATANWTSGDALATTVVEYRVQGTASYTTATTLAAGVVTYTFTGLARSTAYEWRVKHVRNGQSSSYYGPVVATQFTTTASGGTLLPPTNLAVGYIGAPGDPAGAPTLSVTWTNSGETNVYTEVSRSTTSGGTYTVLSTVAIGLASYSDAATSGTWYYKVRHTKAGETASAYAGPASATVP